MPSMMSGWLTEVGKQASSVNSGLVCECSAKNCVSAIELEFTTSTCNGQLATAQSSTCRTKYRIYYLDVQRKANSGSSSACRTKWVLLPFYVISRTRLRLRVRWALFRKGLCPFRAPPHTHVEFRKDFGLKLLKNLSLKGLIQHITRGTSPTGRTCNHRILPTSATALPNTSIINLN
jgi:hypothetical protein